ncbi:unnamed protein product [Larinioides sclopetarius]|uniref:Uncharacterized protein n=1 Tax=Larinioides sclopetarius TaxID=280406 RepID=A0AAV1YWW9_9ARAC
MAYPLLSTSGELSWNTPMGHVKERRTANRTPLTLRQNQKDLQIELYQGLLNFVESRARNENMLTANLIILPSSFQCSPSHMQLIIKMLWQWYASLLATMAMLSMMLPVFWTTSSESNRLQHHVYARTLQE